ATSELVTGAVCGVGHENLPFGRRGVPKDFRHTPRPVRVVNEPAVPERFERFLHAPNRLSSRALEKRARLRIDRRPKKIVPRRVTYVEANARFARPQL